MNMQKMLKRAKEMEEKVRQTLDEMAVESTVGGGMVTVRMNGHKLLLNVKIDPEAMDPDDPELLEDLVLAAVNEATRKVDEEMNHRFGAMAGAIPKLL